MYVPLQATFTPPDGPILNVEQQGDGAPFLFQHGLCGSAAQTAEVFPVDCDFQRVTIEARGHGRSAYGGFAQLTISQFADDCADYVAQSYDAPIVVGGISMGAAIALRLAVMRPELVRALVIARPAWITDAAPENMKPNAEVGDLLEKQSRENALEAFRASATFADLSAHAPDNLNSLLSFFDRAPQLGTAALLRRISIDGPGVSAAQVSSLKVPTLIIGHGRDAIHPFGHAAALAKLIAHGQLIEITPKATSKANYIIEFQAALHKFLKGLTR